MSREIDERVVQMKFERGSFDRDIQTSIHNLEELKKGLDFKNATRGFDEFDRAARNTDISALGKAAEQVQIKFGALEVLALRTMTRISDAAIDAGEKLVKSLTIEQLSPGWEKYAQKTSSVQTIMAATANQFSDTAEQMEVVNAQLDKLNWFTDETSYNFVDMVNNIGKFTSNNIALDQSVTAMQGIANWAAISGANANEASRAMYNLAQALATGSVKLIDWKSIENANMATTEFKQTVIDIATEMGTLKKVGEDAWSTLDGKAAVSVANFNEGLSKGWFTNDVLMSALNRYGAAAEKINEIYETLGAEVTTSRITKGIDNYIAALSDARAEIEGMDLSVEEANKRIAESTQSVAQEVADEWGVSLEEATSMLNEFDDATMQFGLKAFKAAQEAKTFGEAIESVKDAVSTGWMKTFELMFGDYTHAKELWTNLANTLYDIFAAGGDARNEMLEIWAEKGGRDYFVDTIYASLAAIMSILTPIKAAWEEVFGRMTAEKLLAITQRIHNFVLSLVQTEESMSKIARVFRGLFSILDIIKTVITQVVTGGFNVLQRVFAELNIDVGEFAATLGDGLFEIRNWVKESDIIPQIFEKIGDALIWVIQQAREFIAAIQEFGPLQNLIAGIRSMFGQDFQGISGIFTALGGVVLWLWDQLKNFKIPRSFDDVIQFFKDLWKTVKESFEEIGVNFEWIEGLFSNFTAAVQSGLGAVNAAFNTTTTVVGGALQYLGRLFADVDWSGVLLAGFGVATLAILWKLTEALQGFAGALKNVTGVGASAKGAMDAIKGYFTALKENIQANNILKIAASIIMLSIAFALIARLEWGQIMAASLAMATMGIALAGLGFVFSKLNTMGFDAKGLSKFLTALGAAILLMAVALRAIPEDIEIFDKRVIALLEVVAGLAAAVTAMSLLTKGAIINTAGLIGFAASIYILINVMKKLGEEDVMSIYAAIIPVTVLMLVLGYVSKLVTYTKKITTETEGGGRSVVKMGGGFANTIGVVLGLMLLISAIKKLGKMDIDTAAQGILLMIPTVIMLGVLFKASAKAGQYASSAGKMILFLAAGLAILIPVVKGFAKMDPDILIKGGIAITLLNTAIMLPLIAVSKQSGQHATKAGLMILEIAGAMAILQLVIKTLGRIDLPTLAKGVGGVAAVILALAVVVNAMHGTVETKADDVKVMTKMIIIVGIISALILLLTAINPTGALVVCAGIAAVFASLAIMFNLMNGIELPDTGKLIAIVGGVALIGIIIGIMGAITNWQGALAVAGGMSAIILALAAVTQIVKNSATSDALMKKTKILAKFVLKLSGIMAILALVMGLFNHFGGGNATDILVISTAMSELIAATGIMGKLLGSLSLPTSKQLNDLMYFVAGIAVIVGVLALIIGALNGNDIDTSGLLVYTTAISEVILAMSAAIKLMNEVEDPEISIKTIAAMGTAIILIGALLGAWTYLVQEYNMEGLLVFTTGLSEVLIAFGVAMKIMNEVEFELGWKQILSMTALIGAIGTILGLFAYFVKEYDIMGLIGFATSISILLIAVSLVALILSKFPEGASQGALEGLLIAIAIIAGVGILLGVLGAVNKLIPGAGSLLEDGASILMTIGNGIGGFFGGIISGIGAGLTSALPQMTQDLSDAMDNFMPFFADLEQIPGGALGFIGTLLGVVAAITGAEFIAGLSAIPGIAQLISAGADKLVDNFKLFGQAIKGFAEEIDGINAYKVKLAADAVSELGAMESSMGGLSGLINTLIGGIFGTDDFSKFGERLRQLGTALCEFADSTSTLDYDAVDKASTCAQALMALENGMPRRDGVLASFLGQDGFDQFGKRLSDLGFALRMFSMYAAMVDPAAVENGRAAGESLVQLEESMTRIGGLVGFIFGNKDLGDFAGRLTTFGDGLQAFSKKVTGLRPLEFTNAVQITKQLIEVEDLIGNHGGLKGMIFGDGSFDEFGKGLKSYGDSLALFSQYVSQVNFDRIYTAITYMKMLVGLDSIGEVQIQVVAAAKDILKIIKETIMQNESSMKKHGTSVVYWIAKGFEEGTSVHMHIVTDAAKKIAKKFVDTFESEMEIHSPSLVMKEEGKYVIQGLAEGITEETAAEEAIKKKAQNLAAAFDAEISKFSSQESRSSLLLRLWQATDGYSATESEVALRQYELDKEKLANLAKTVNLRQEELRITEEIAGKASAEYADAETSYLEALANLKEFEHEINKSYEAFISGEQATFERKEKTLDLEFQLWQLTEGINATEAQIAAKQQEIDAAKLANLAKTVNLREQELSVIESIYGVESLQYEQARHNYLQAQIDMENSKQQYNTNYGASTGDTYQSLMKAYADWQKENAQAYEMLGYSKEKLSDDAFKAVFKLTDDDLRKMKTANALSNQNSVGNWLLENLGFSTDGVAVAAQKLTGWENSWESLMQHVSGKALETADEIIAQNMNTYDFNDIYGNIAATTAQITTEGMASYMIDSAETFDMAAAEVLQNTLADKNSKTSGAAKSAGKSAGESFGAGFTSGAGNSIVQAITGGSGSMFKDLGGWTALQDTMDKYFDTSSLFDKAVGKYFDMDAINKYAGQVDGIADQLYGWLVEGSDDALGQIKSLASEYGVDYVLGMAESITDSGVKQTFYNAINSGVLGPLTEGVTGALGIHSPSTVAFGYGEFYMQGFANGLEDNMGLIEDQMEQMVDIIKRYVDYAQSLINSVLSSMGAMTATITPVIDMDSLKKQVSTVSATVSGSLSASTSKAVANSISSSKMAASGQNGIAGVPASSMAGTTNYNFTQNNYSPKALSRVEIYRQTSNQFSMIKEATKK